MEDPNTTQLLLEYYSSTSPPLSNTALECLVSAHSWAVNPPQGPSAQGANSPMCPCAPHMSGGACPISHSIPNPGPHGKGCLKQCMGMDCLGRCIGIDCLGRCIGIDCLGRCNRMDCQGRCIGIDCLGRCIGMDCLGRCNCMDCQGQCFGMAAGPYLLAHECGAAAALAHAYAPALG